AMRRPAAPVSGSPVAEKSLPRQECRTPATHHDISNPAAPTPAKDAMPASPAPAATKTGPSLKEKLLQVSKFFKSRRGSAPPDPEEEAKAMSFVMEFLPGLQTPSSAPEKFTEFHK